MSSQQAQIATINGGIEFECSDYLADQTLPAILPIPNSLTLPLGDDIHRLAKPIVKIGDPVFTGQLIAKSENSTDIMVHASSSGKAVAIQEKKIASENNTRVPCIVIETDGKDSPDLNRSSGFSDYKQIAPSVLHTHIVECGITDLDGPTFEPTEVLIINAIECEPFINRNEILIQHYVDDLVTGIKILQHVLQPKQCVIAIEENRKTAIQTIKPFINDADIQIKLVENRYPIGHKKLLEQALFRNKSKLKNVVSLELETIHAVKQAVIDNIPWIKRLITVVDSTNRKVINRWVHVGTEIEQVFKQADVLYSDDNCLMMGSPMQGVLLNDANMPISKKTESLFITSGQEQKARTCIRCDECVTVCPVLLQPQQLHKFSQSFNTNRLNQFALFDCIECGCCDYVCPSHIPLVNQFRKAKKAIQQEQQATENLQRYENKRMREKKREQEKKQRSAVKAKQAFESKDTELMNKQQVIADAVARVKEKRKKSNNIN